MDRHQMKIGAEQAAGGEGEGGEEKVPGRERLGDEGYYRSSLAEFASSE